MKICRVWLKKASALLKDVSTDRPRYYHGFDISAAQFPKVQDGINFSVQDVLKPFSAAHLNRYDLVHVRVLFCGLKKDEYGPAVENLKTLLSEIRSLKFRSLGKALPLT